VLVSVSVLGLVSVVVSESVGACQDIGDTLSPASRER